jgi:two-component sensor histidine kinase
MKQLQLMHELELRSDLQRENAWKDSILHKEQQLAMALSGENEHRKKELEAEKKVKVLLSNENSEQQGLLSRERKLRLLLLSAFFSTAVLGAIAFSFYRKQRKKNSIIQKQSEDMQTLMKEIHHRVKNNLQVISSLLDLQASSIKHDQAYEAVREGRNRVQSMALLHQNLYSDGNIKGIRVKNYIDNLAQGLFASYNINPETVVLSTDIDDLNLDVDTVIPIGLILNELISNSLKYAFNLKQQGRIIVELKKINEILLLRVKDNGQGFTSLQSLDPGASFGIKLIKAFARKLKAKLDIYNDNGACVEMQIHRFKLAPAI